jgi:Zn-dependent protease with chaperone function
MVGARSLVLAHAPAPVLAVRLEFPAVSLVGTRRPWLFVAEPALSALTPDELTVVLAHEGAHVRARDNLKALLVEAAVVPFGLGDEIARDWMQAAEEDADERAVGGSADRALALASALVKVARLTPAGASLALAGTTLHRGEGLALRVNRLLAGPGSTRSAGGSISREQHLTLLALGVLAVVGSLPFALPAVHRALETVVRALP